MFDTIKNMIDKYQLNVTGVVHVGGWQGWEYHDYINLGINNMMFFEPVPTNFDVLKRGLEGKAILHNVALGNFEGITTMYVEEANNGQSSSVLEPATHLDQYPHIQFTKQITVPIKKLDNYIPELNQFNMLNIDVQGYELEVLKGANKFLQWVDLIVLEINRAELYKNCAQIQDVISFLSPYGFEVHELNWHGGTWGDGFFVKK